MLAEGNFNVRSHALHIPYGVTDTRRPNDMLIATFHILRESFIVRSAIIGSERCRSRARSWMVCVAQLTVCPYQRMYESMLDLCYIQQRI